MYPTFSELLKDLFGIDIYLPIQTYGFFLSLAFLSSYWVARHEILRKHKKGTFNYPINQSKPKNPLDHLYYMVLLAVIFGLLGTKIFADLEQWQELVEHPLQVLFSYNGISFLGGLVVGSIAVASYAKAHKLPVFQLMDAAAIAIPFAYGVGRIGCQVSGDGCWGQYNAAYAHPDSIPKSAYALGQVTSFKPPEWLHFIPDWFFAYTYPHNTANKGLLMQNCTWEHCHVLAAPVFPTPFYETLLMMFIVLILLFLKKKLRIPGLLFAWYLILAGLERFFIEKIRINKQFDFLGYRLSQAAIIALYMIGVGIVWMVFLYLKSQKSSNDKINIS